MLFHRITILHLAAQNSKQIGVAHVQFRRTFWSEQNRSGQTDLVCSLKTRRESLGRRENGLVPDGTARERSDADKNAPLLLPTPLFTCPHFVTIGRQI